MNADKQIQHYNDVKNEDTKMILNDTEATEKGTDPRHYGCLFILFYVICYFFSPKKILFFIWVLSIVFVTFSTFTMVLNLNVPCIHCFCLIWNKVLVASKFYKFLFFLFVFFVLFCFAQDPNSGQFE
ncbi:hypothetical protein RFI_08507 [Reticulomyxa filosa]|uniref:Uncharacterized protein n=1 Tax=Reticulomyxa filosa TaxID=46433 RepID=X6NTJ1_RETFI|nr:hypothetical protein RFI_08507 [Reticulomyxa filosa]|eukprot:ETO28622.1 hypothetical protein RFI_08507 [Reticulomyxa filosa]